MGQEKIKGHHKSRIAYVYVRQSTQYQVNHNLESQRRQYQLTERAKELGFQDIRVIDEDLGVSGGLGTERAGFKKLVAEISLNKVGIVFGLEVSRFARNNRDLYHLIDLCALFDTLIADQDEIYHPGTPNDRMVLGLKGTMSEVEINLIKQRMLEGAKNKAKRGELIYRLPVGLIKTEDNKIEKDPNERVRKTIDQVFLKFRESQSVRQTFLWFIQENISFPATEYGKFGKKRVWKPPVYGTIYDVLKNPFYSGAYVYGRRETKIFLEGERIKKSKGHMKEIEDWEIIIEDNHEGYIGWNEYLKNQAIMGENNARTSGWKTRGALLKGGSLLAGLLRCKRCGRKLTVSYGGKNSKVPHYSCTKARIYHGEKKDCISFGGLRLDGAVGGEVLKVVEPLAVDASLKAIEDLSKGVEEERKLLELELQSTEYEAERAYRQYNKVDPENRLVGAQLERKWNSCLERCEEVKKRLSEKQKPISPLSAEGKKELLSLSSDLPELWNSSSTTNEMRKRIVRTVIKEIMCDVDEDNFLILLDIHWEGGNHTRLEVKKNRTGEHRNCTEKSVVEIVRDLSLILPDKAIAPILNRLKLKTGAGNNWTRDRVKWARNKNGIKPFSKVEKEEFTTLQNAAAKLGVCAQSVRSLINRQVIDARQVVSCAPWIIRKEELEKEEVKVAVSGIKNGSNRRNQYSRCSNQLGLFQ
jgi:DNA invertase Pin-like site-specific DNA recombinase